MEANFGGKTGPFYGPVVSDLNSVGKRSLEWDLNNWRWDGDLFQATPVNSGPLDCRSRQLFPVGPIIPGNAGLLESSSLACEDINVGNGKGKRELDKRSRDEGIGEEEPCDETGSLNLKLGGRVYPIVDEDVKSGKKTKVVVTSSSRAVCQVDDCRADLSNAKDYHRRHKVCEMHSKASEALVRNVKQRFCQQCSRFHVLQEFDEGKRSCRRRLAGHNKRRRKTNSDTPANGGPVNDENSCKYLLISLLRTLSNMHAHSSDQTKDQDLLSHLLKNLASVAGPVNGSNLPGLLRGSQDNLISQTPTGTNEKMPDVSVSITEPAVPSSSPLKACNIQNPLRVAGQSALGTASVFEQKRITIDNAQLGCSQAVPGLFPSESALADLNESDTVVARSGLNNIDLNSAYDASQDCVENLDRNQAAGTLESPPWVQDASQRSSPPQTSRNSDTTLSSSPSSSSGEAQSRTDRIVFKLFGKDPNDFPLALRTQILDWLSHSPTDIESYIRPGCVILTIYLRLGKPSWEELSCGLGSSLKRLLDASHDSFWKTGWVYVRAEQNVSFVYDGQIVLDTSLPLTIHKTCQITSIKPIAVPLSEQAEFVVQGYSLSCATGRLHCAVEGNYLVRESCVDVVENNESSNEHNMLQCLRFSCSMPSISGRGFIEVEDNCLSSSFFPFIVAEKEVCCEICTLENVIEMTESADNFEGKEESEAKNQALDFIHEMGWLLHRNNLKFRLGDVDPSLNCFSFNRFRWLMEFSIDHDWCAVVKKLLCILYEGTVDSGEHPSVIIALSDLCLLHRAVQRKCRPMVELLLNFSPKRGLEEHAGPKGLDDSGYCALFRPDVAGPGGLTPLHLVASIDGSESVLDALTDDPGSVGIQAWKSVRDDTGLAPNDYACLRGHYSYIHLVQRKMKSKSESGHVVVDIPTAPVDWSSKKKQLDGYKSAKVTSFHTEKFGAKTTQQNCKLCEVKMGFSTTRTSLVYRPAMISLLVVAAVCVCVALLFKSSPEVLYVLQPFRWEELNYGSM